MSDTPFPDRPSRFVAGRLGLLLFLVSLGMLFAACVIGFLVIRIQLGQKGVWPDDLPSLPPMLWVSTAILIASSITIQWGVRAIENGDHALLHKTVLVTTILGFAFLAVQCYCWISWLGPVSDRWHRSHEYRYALSSFYVLTGLHGLHVIGGLIPMVNVAVRSYSGHYSRENHAGVQYCALYWHFLDAVWIVLFITLKLADI